MSEKSDQHEKKLSFTVGTETDALNEPPASNDRVSDSVNFREFFFSSVQKAFTDEYTRCLNYDDTITVLREAYILMFQELDRLRHSPSVQWWMRKCRNTAYNGCVRRKKLNNIYEREEGESFPEISYDDIFELWKTIKKVGNVNSFVILPHPLGSVKTGKALKNYILSMSPQKIINIITVSGIAIFLVIFTIVFYTKVLPLFKSDDGNTYIEEEEIFLDDSFFEQFNITTVDIEIDTDIMDDIINDAAERADEKVKQDEQEALNNPEEITVSSQEESSTNLSDKDYEFLSRDPKDAVKTTTTTTVQFIAQEVNGEGARNTAANAPTYTGDEWLDRELKNVVSLLLKSTMSDSEKLASLYEYTCKYGSYGECDYTPETYIDRAKYFFKYRTGTSAEYASAYYALCSAAGYKCKIINGYFITNSANGRNRCVEHTWCMITLNGIEYHFDPEADSDSNGSTVNKNFFFVAKDNSRWRLFCATHNWTGKNE